MKKALNSAACAALAVFAFGAAQAQETSHAGKNALKFENMIATVAVNLEESATGITVEVSQGNTASYTLTQSESGNAVVVKGPSKPDQKQFWRQTRGLGNFDARVKTYMMDYPVVTITAPLGSDIVFEDFISILNITNTAGSVKMDDAIYASGFVGDARKADIGLSGGGTLRFGKIAETLNAAIGGSGDLSFDSAASASLRIGGSGDLKIGAIGGDVDAKIGGSGDIRLGDIAGDADFTIGGSGDIETGTMKGLDVTIGGSGEVTVASVDGPVGIKIAGSGEVTINGGHATDFTASIAGAGDLRFNGLASNPSVSVMGAGDIFVAEYDGNVSIRGDKDDVQIGDYRPAR